MNEKRGCSDPRDFNEFPQSQVRLVAFTESMGIFNVPSNETGCRALMTHLKPCWKCSNTYSAKQEELDSIWCRIKGNKGTDICMFVTVCILLRILPSSYFSSYDPDLIHLVYTGIAQLVEQWTFMWQVPGSIPAPDSSWLGVDSALHPSVGRLNWVPAKNIG